MDCQAASADINPVANVPSIKRAEQLNSLEPGLAPYSCRRYCALLTLWALLGLATTGLASSRSDFRLGQNSKWTSFSFLAGSSLISGERAGIGANGFTALMSADSLYRNPRHLELEYGEHNSRTTLTFGLGYTQVTVSDNLRTELGLADGAALSVSYLDAPVTYRLNAYPAGRSPLNFSVGVSLIAMVDIASSTELVFESGSNVTTGSLSGSSGALANKHVDFGLGFGGEVGVERQISGNVFLTARAGFRHPFTGVTRPDFGFFLAGFRLYQW